MSSSTCSYCHQPIGANEPWDSYLREGVYEYAHGRCRKEAEERAVIEEFQKEFNEWFDREIPE